MVWILPEKCNRPAWRWRACCTTTRSPKRRPWTAPPKPTAGSAGTIDSGFLTALTPDMYFDHATGRVVPNPEPDTAGLWIAARNGSLHRISVPRDCMAIQCGESVQVVTGGKLVATPHCVRPPVKTPGISRCSMPVFVSGCRCSVRNDVSRPQGGSFPSPGVEQWVPPLADRWTGQAELRRVPGRQFQGILRPINCNKSIAVLVVARVTVRVPLPTATRRGSAHGGCNICNVKETLARLAAVPLSRFIQHCVQPCSVDTARVGRIRLPFYFYTFWSPRTKSASSFSYSATEQRASSGSVMAGLCSTSNCICGCADRRPTEDRQPRRPRGVHPAQERQLQVQPRLSCAAARRWRRRTSARVCGVAWLPACRRRLPRIRTRVATAPHPSTVQPHACTSSFDTRPHIRKPILLAIFPVIGAHDCGSADTRNDLRVEVRQHAPAAVAGVAVRISSNSRHVLRPLWSRTRSRAREPSVHAERHVVASGRCEYVEESAGR